MAFEFDKTSRRRFEWLLSRYPTKRAVLLPALRLVEEQTGVIDDEAISYVARELELPASLVRGVYTFYTHYRRPGDGKYVVMVCRTLPCALRGAALVCEWVREELGLQPGETTSDGKFTFRKVECLGSCTTAPVMQINDDYFEAVTREKVREIFAALKKDEVPPHISNGPTLDGGRKNWEPLIEATTEKKDV